MPSLSISLIASLCKSAFFFYVRNYLQLHLLLLISLLNPSKNIFKVRPVTVIFASSQEVWHSVKTENGKEQYIMSAYHVLC